MITDLKEKKRTIYSSLPMQLFMIEAIKAPLLKVACLIASKLPEPTIENTWHPNSHRMIERRDEFFEHCFLPEPRRTFIRMAINFVIIIYDFDSPWRMMIDWFIEPWHLEGWQLRGYGEEKQPIYDWWKE